MVLFLELKASIKTHKTVEYTEKARLHTSMWQNDFDLAVRGFWRLITHCHVSP